MDGPLPENLVDSWKEFLALRSTGVPEKTLDDLFNNDVLYPLQRRREMERFHELVNEIQPKTLMEIGADKGGSVWAWCKSIPTLTRVIVCEIRGTPYSDLMEAAFPHIEFVWVPYSSYDPRVVEAITYGLSDEWGHGVPLEIDALFIDGDKSAFDKDWECYYPLVRSKGIIALHDIFDSPIDRVFRDLVSKYPSPIIIKDISDYHHFRDQKRHWVSQYEWWLDYWKGASACVGLFYKE